jgi:transglutaminase-like putative cysteine protease
MHVISGRRLLRLPLLLAFSAPLACAQWTVPTPEELSMTTQREVPGAAAVYLYREEITEDKLHMFSIYTRLKVLTERGKEYSNVELHYASMNEGASLTIDSIQGRTIHPDGSIVLFTGKPYDKLVEKTGGIKIMSKVFTMPDVEVGSIIEYRYKLRYSDGYFMHPDWYIQSDLFTRKAHYTWKPTSETLVSSDDQLTNSIAWTPVLPPGVELKQTHLPPTSQFMNGQLVFDLDVHDVPPAPSEEFMPPVSSLSYRVLFYYSPYLTSAEFWKNQTKRWAKARDKFIGPGSAVKDAVKAIVQPSDTQDQKLRKIYAAVMKLENTSYTREHSSAEEKAQGFKEIHNTDDIWTRKRGNNDEIAELFIAMARAAGMKAYAGAVTNRDQNLFVPGYLTLSQLDDIIAIVNVDGKDQYFDPGSRYCPFQHLAWKHSHTQGIRQTDAGGDFFSSPVESYTYSQTARIANLTIDQHAAVSGTIEMRYTGSPALHWRQRSLTGDATSLEQEIRTSVEQMVPQGLEVKVGSINQLDAYDQPLIVKLEVKGTLGSVTGKRLLLPADIFEVNSKPTFPHAKREIPIYFDYAQTKQDAIRINFPPNLTVESLPPADKSNFEKFAIYNMATESTATSFTVRRIYVMAEIFYKTDEYAGLRDFYSKFENKDQESVVLTTAPTAAKATPTGN